MLDERSARRGPLSKLGSRLCKRFAARAGVDLEVPRTVVCVPRTVNGTGHTDNGTGHLEVDAGARGEALAEARAELRQRSATGRPLVEQLRDLDVAPARCDSARLAELNDALASATAKVRDSASGAIDRLSRRRVDGVKTAPRRSPRKKRAARSRTKASRNVLCA